MFGNYLGTSNLKGRPGDEKRIKGAAPAARYTKASTSAPTDTTGIRCQKCLKMGHFSYDCKNPPVYKSRPTRTQQLLNPKKVKDGPSVPVPAEFGGSGQPVTSNQPLAIESGSGLAAKILKDKEQKRKRRRSASSSDSSDSSSESDISDSDSDSDSSSSGSSSSGSASSRGSRSRQRNRRARSTSRSRSPPRRRRRSPSEGSPRRSASPRSTRERQASRDDRSASPPARTMNIKGRARD